MMQRKPAPILMVLALVGAPLTAQAQDEKTPAAEATEAASDEAEPEATESEAEAEDPAEEATTEAEAGRAPLESEAEPEVKDEADGDDAATGAAAAGTAAAGAAAAAEGEAGAATEAAEDEDKTTNAAALGAASPVVASGGKPWLVSASLQTSLGSSVLADQNNDPVFGYSFSATGLYKLTNLWMGRLDAYTFLTFNQNLTNEGVAGNVAGGTGNNQFYFQDLQLGLLGRGVFTEKVTGIIFGARSIARLPTSDAAQAFDRVLRWDNGLTMAKPFPNVGPGTIILSYSTTFRKDFGPTNPTIDIGESPTQVSVCAAVNSGEAGSCASDIAPLDWAWINSLGARYLLNNGLGFNFAISALWNRFHDIRFPVDSLVDVDGNPIPNVGNVDLNSDFALLEDNKSLAIFTSISVSYVFNANWSISGGIQTFQNALVNTGDGNNTQVSNIVFANDPETNATNFFLAGTFTY
jgi:hypothetical protein